MEKEITRKEFVNKIYKEYNFIEKNDLDEIINEEMKISNSFNNENLLIEKRIYNRLNEFILKKLTNKEFINLMNRFIEYNFITGEEYSYKNIKNLEKFFNKIKYEVSFDKLLKLIKENEHLSQDIEFIFNSNEDKLKNTPIEKVFDDAFMIDCIEIYCAINDINLELNEYKDIDINQNDVVFSDSVKMYLKEISGFPVLSREEEIELINRMKKNDIEAKVKLINCNLKLVVSIAKHYNGRGLPFSDLIEEGNLGLMKAIDKFDPTKGYKISTFAIWWIRQTILRAISNSSRIVRLPVYIEAYTNDYKKTYGYLRQELQREPTLEEISEKMEISVDKLQDIINLMQEIYSLNRIIGEDGSEFGDFIPYDFNIENTVINSTLKGSLVELIKAANLKKRDQEILFYRYGVYDGKKYTLTELSKIYDVTEERIRQIEARALKKVRSIAGIKKLAVFTDDEESAIKNLNYLSNQKFLQNKNCNQDLSDNNYKKEIFKTIYILLEPYPVNDINFAIKRLDYNDANLLNLIYGRNLDKPVYGRVTKSETNKFFHELLPRIEYMILNKAYNPYKKVEIDYNIKNFIEIRPIKFFLKPYSLAEICSGINILSLEDMNLLNRIYGNDLESPSLKIIKVEDFEKFINILIPKLSRIIQVIKNEKSKQEVVISNKKGKKAGNFRHLLSIDELLDGYGTTESKRAAYDRLSQAEKKLIEKRNDESITMSKKEKLAFSVVINKLRKMAVNPNYEKRSSQAIDKLMGFENKEDRSIYTILKDFGTREEIDEKIKCLDDSEIELLEIREKNNGDLDGEIRKASYVVLNKLKKLLSDPNYKPKNVSELKAKKIVDDYKLKLSKKGNKNRAE